MRINSWANERCRITKPFDNFNSPNSRTSEGEGAVWKWCQMQGTRARLVSFVVIHEHVRAYHAWPSISCQAPALMLPKETPWHRFVPEWCASEHYPTYSLYDKGCVIKGVDFKQPYVSNCNSFYIYGFSNRYLTFLMKILIYSIDNWGVPVLNSLKE